MTRSKKAAEGTHRSSTPTCPTNGNFGYRVSRYELDLEYKVNINRLAGTATITAVTLAVAADVHASTCPTRCRCRRCRSTAAGPRISAVPRGKLHVTLGVRPARRVRRCRSPCATPAPRDPSDPFGVKSDSRSSPTAPWSRASPTARRPGSRATTTPAARRATASRSPPTTRTTRSPTASWCPAAPGPRMTTWTYEQAEPTSTYLVTLQIGEYEPHRLAKNAGADECRAAGTGCAATSTTTSGANRR